MGLEGANMMRARSAAAGFCLVLIGAGACTSGSEPASEKTSEPSLERGGTLRVGMPLLPFSTLTGRQPLDPQREYSGEAWGLFRCCLLRTLFSYPGRPTEEGGSELRPDLAAAMPQVSRNGLTWTVRLKEGLHYAPPFQDTEIVAQDLIRALEREGNKKAVPDGVAYDFYYSAIDGFDEFRAGDADSISGLEAPDDRTLVVHLNEPAGDLAHRFALAATAPIPPGAADGHDANYGRFLVASGPYMLEGSEEMDFSLSPREQVPAAGIVPKKSIKLVRNPSWDPASDALRPAYIDRIQMTLEGSTSFDATQKTLRRMSRQMDAGTFDLLMYWGPWPQASVRQVRTYQRDPELRDQVFVNSNDAIWYISINTALRPFDDVHVRKALNLVVDKAALRERAGGPLAGTIAGHIMLDSLTSNLLLDYDPYSTPQQGGDVDAARAEMARSDYDRDGDGRCDGPSCTGAVGLAFGDNAVRKEQAAIVRDNLEQIGIEIDLQFFDVDTVFDKLSDPTAKVALGIGIGWAKDFINGTNFFIPLFDSAGIMGGNNVSLLGATPKQLEEWGYDVTSVPSIDDKIDECIPLVGTEQVQCWAEADQLLMEQVVPWVPFLSESHVRTVSDRVASYSFDQFTTQPALERIALRRET
jgi:peptide/nickel transport system substrate-binding protein